MKQELTSFRTFVLYKKMEMDNLQESTKYNDIIKAHLDKCTAVLRYTLDSIHFGIQVDTAHDERVFRIVSREHNNLNDRMSNLAEELFKEFKKLGFKATLSNNEYLGVINFNKSGAKIIEIAKKFTEKIKANNPKADVFILADSVRNFEKSYYDAYSQFLTKIEKQEGSEFIDRVYCHKGSTKPLSKKELDKQASDYFAQYYRDNKWTGD